MICEVNQNDKSEDLELTSIRSILNEAEAAGVLELKIHGHTTARAASGDTWEVVEDRTEGVTWVYKPKDVQLSQARLSNVAGCFPSATLNASERVMQVWRLMVDPTQGAIVPKRAIYYLKNAMNSGGHDMELAGGMILRLV